MKLRVKLIFLQVCSFIVSIAPLIIILALKWNDYTETPSDTTKLCFGGIIIAVLVFIKAVGKLHMPNRIVFFGILFILSYLLQDLMKDFTLIMGMALAGEIIDHVFFQRLIKHTKEAIVIGKTADATSDKIEEVMKKYIGNGRV